MDQNSQNVVWINITQEPLGLPNFYTIFEFLGQSTAGCIHYPKIKLFIILRFEIFIHMPILPNNYICPKFPLWHWAKSKGVLECEVRWKVGPLRVRADFDKTVRVCHLYCNFKLGFTCRITVIFGTLKDGSLLINTLASNICFSYRNMFQNGVDALSKIVDAFLSKSSKF